MLFIIKIADAKVNGTGNDVLHTFRKQMKKTPADVDMETDNKVSDIDSDSDVDPEDDDVIERFKFKIVFTAVSNIVFWPVYILRVF